MATLDAYYFTSVERYRTFFQNYNITPNILLDRKIHPNTPLTLNGPQGSCTILYGHLPHPTYLPEQTNVDLYHIIRNNLVFGMFYVVDGGVQPNATELPFVQMYFRLIKFEFVRGNTSGGGKTRHRRRKSRMSKGKKRQTRKK